MRSISLLFRIGLLSLFFIGTWFFAYSGNAEQKSDQGRTYYQIVMAARQSNSAFKLPEDVHKRLSQNPELRRKIALELLTESQRQGFQPFPDKANQILSHLASLFPDLRPISELLSPLPSFSSIPEKDFIQQYRKFSQYTSMKQQMEQYQYCQKLNLLICQADMALKLFAQPELDPKTKQTIIGAGFYAAQKAGHVPLFFLLESNYNISYNNGYFLSDSEILAKKIGLNQVEALQEILLAKYNLPGGHAVPHLKKALELWSDPSIEAQVSLLMGQVNLELRPEEKMAYFQKTIKSAQPQQLRLKTIATFEMAKLKLSFDKLTEAWEDFNQVQELTERYDWVDLKCSALISRAGLLVKQKKREMAKTLFLNADQCIESLPEHLKYHQRFSLLQQLKSSGYQQEIRGIFVRLMNNVQKDKVVERLGDMVSYDPELAADYALQYLSHEELTIRKKAIEVMTYGAGKKHLEILKTLLKHPDWRIRGNVIQPLARHLDQEIIPLVLPLLKDESEHVRGNALAALEQSKYLLPFSEVKQLLEDSEQRVALIAKKMLTKYPEGKILLTEFLVNPKYERLNFTDTFIIDEPNYSDREIERLIEMLGSHYPHVAEGANRSLKYHFSFERWVKLVSILEKEPTHSESIIDVLKHWAKPELLTTIQKWSNSPNLKLRSYFERINKK